MFLEYMVVELIVGAVENVETQSFSLCRKEKEKLVFC